MAYDFIYKPFFQSFNWVGTFVLPVKDNMVYCDDLMLLTDPDIRLRHYKLFAKEAEKAYRLMAILITGKMIREADPDNFEDNLERYLSKVTAFDKERLWLIESNKKEGIGLENRRRLEELLGVEDLYAREPCCRLSTRHIFDRKYGEGCFVMDDIKGGEVVKVEGGC